MKAEVVTLQNLAQGALAEIFDYEMSRVMANVRDVNADARKKRRITITIDLQPYADRSGAQAVTSVTAKLVPVNSVTSNLYLTMVDGQLKAMTKDIRQQELPLEPVAESAAGVKVVSIGG